MTATQKLRNLVKQQVRRMENRGYRIAPEVKEKIKSGKYQALKSIQRNKYKKLYESSTSEIEGKIVGGTEKRRYERKEAARKSAQTRYINKNISVVTNTASREEAEAELYDRDWERQRRKQDEQDRLNAELYAQGRIAYDSISNLIEQYPTPGSKMLANAFRSEISKYGQDKVIKAMGDAPQTFIDTAQQIIYYEDESAAIHSALVSFFEVITGTILSTEESKEMGETMDQMTDFGSF